MPVIGLLINETKPEAVATAQRLVAALAERGVAVRALASTALAVGDPDCEADEGQIAAANFVVVLGGDGTLLAAARRLAPCGTPILGIHLGRFGFIAESLPHNLLDAVDNVLRGHARTEPRLLLATRVLHAAAAVQEMPLGMNDVVVKSSAARLVHVRVSVGVNVPSTEPETQETGFDEVATYAADGVIVASPTGSTSYSLSAGGPLVQPTAPVLLITPICPHTLNARSLVVPDTHAIRLEIAEHDPRDTVIATIDGQIECALHPGDWVEVRRSPHTANLLTVGGPNFYQKLRARWRYGERLQG